MADSEKNSEKKRSRRGPNRRGASDRGKVAGGAKSSGEAKSSGDSRTPRASDDANPSGDSKKTRRSGAAGNQKSSGRANKRRRPGSGKKSKSSGESEKSRAASDAEEPKSSGDAKTARGASDAGEPKSSGGTRKPRRRTPRAESKRTDTAQRDADEGKRNERDESRRQRSAQRIEGDITVTSKGFGFVQIADGPDIFVHRDNLGTALEGDRVRVEVFPGSAKHKPAGRVIEVVNRVEHPIVGVFRKNREGGGEIFPSDDRIVSSFLIPAAEVKRAGLGRKLRNNTVVKASFSEWHSPTQKPTAHLEAVVGKPNEPGIDVKIIALSRGLRLDFPEEVEAEAAKLTLPDMRREKRHRLDITRRPTFTIDPDDAQDFDDALSVRQLDSGLFEIGVHIADVTALVPEGGSIDTEARRRATSVYFVKEVLPMLPEKLSNDLCSLKPNTERLAYSCFITVDSLGNVHNSEVRETVIKSDFRLTYTDAQQILEGRPHEVARDMHTLQLLARALRTARERSGSIDFDLPSPVITLDRDGLPAEVTRSERSESQRLIEEFMLLANRRIAESIFRSGRRKAFVYRIHERPSPEDVATLQTVLRNLGIPLTIPEEVSPEDFSRILDVVESLDVRDFVERIALRSMTKAIYSTANAGHFGLAFEAYTHFTSPIRRYADLTVHRLLKSYNSRFSRVHKSLREDLEAICEQCSRAERVAVEAERDYQRKKTMEFLHRKIGRSYQGVIAGVSRYGMFVELEHYPIEGMVPVESIGEDTYLLDEDNFRFVGESSGASYRIGDPVRVKIRSVDVNERRAYFDLQELDRSAARQEHSARR